MNIKLLYKLTRICVKVPGHRTPKRILVKKRSRQPNLNQNEAAIRGVKGARLALPMKKIQKIPTLIEDHLMKIHVSSHERYLPLFEL